MNITRAAINPSARTFFIVPTNQNLSADTILQELRNFYPFDNFTLFTGEHQHHQSPQTQSHPQHQHPLLSRTMATSIQSTMAAMAAAAATAAAAINDNDATKESFVVVVTVTVLYALIFAAGLLGNVITCTVISKNKSMHTATNYYLFNLAISDLMLLLSGMPLDIHSMWYPESYPFNQSVCLLQGLLSETSANATVLTITAFTIERYIAICHPFRQHTMSKLSRAIRFIMVIWIVAFCLAIPQALQFGIVETATGKSCTVKNIFVEHAFEVSSFLFFVGPMSVICVLYVLIGIKLRKSKLLQGAKQRKGVDFQRGVSGQTRVIRMLVAVAVAFFLCWAPFHAQRLMAVYGTATNKNETDLYFAIYKTLTYISGLLYFLSTCINPLLYSIMSHKFRNAFKNTIARKCGLGPVKSPHYPVNHTYSALSRGSLRQMNRTNIANDTPIIGKCEPTINMADNAISIEANHCAVATYPNYHQRPRCISLTSQSTLLTTLSRVDVPCHHRSTVRSADQPVDTIPSGDGESNNSLPTPPQSPNDKCTDHIEMIANCNDLQKIPSFRTKSHVHELKSTKSPSALTSFTEKLRLLFHTTPNGNISAREEKLHKTNSVESAHTNTISNSSLQEIDDTEFNSSDLIRYMEEVNNEIR